MPIFSLSRILKMGVLNFWRNIWLSLATTLVMILTLLSFSILLILNLIGNVAVDNIKAKIDITIYLKSNLTEDQIAALQKNIEEINGVAQMEYISSEKALENFRQKHQDNRVIADILKEFTDNPLEPVFVVKAENPEGYPAIVKTLEEARYQELIRKVNYKDNQVMISRITTTANSLANVGMIISAIFATIAVLVMFNTIRLTIYSRSAEIEIMKIVGATNWYVRWPMIIEGILYGLIAAIISLIILYPATRMISPKIEIYFQGYGLNLAQYFSAHIFQIIGLQILAGVSLGVLSSSIAVGKYLRR
ncbi:MAG: permease-like cell division protein FtsX [bacterium]|nr:permease-like cell division protein FtsX [bacterium]